MLLPRAQAPLRAALAASSRTAHASTSPAASLNVLDVLRASLAASSPSPNLTFVRHATHQAQGRANGPKNGAGKRLGAKKTGEQYVVPGNIIFRQRGSLWFPGENCAMGRDHTIHATASGYVKYYRDPAKHPKRRYIGVVFERTQTLPSPPHAARRRRLGMMAVPRADATDALSSVEGERSGDLTHRVHKNGVDVKQVPAKKKKNIPEKNLTLRPGYMYREANWEIGRIAERAGVADKVSKFVPGDRFKAWRKATARQAKIAEKRSMRGRKVKK
ncbi:ribosomal protein l27 [Diplodia corticola]|uniref:Large ribosomal subunit protein bL27m n=1 Tax=Diplodia corticola TaxID=236234 RepID=A0A1J9QZH7_9PEZI|nr:ribosomal protein l27 [Diplodia corticola]OJD33394.1 ribosomal protein l27 [Diplodia corticola]